MQNSLTCELRKEEFMDSTFYEMISRWINSQIFEKEPTPCKTCKKSTKKIITESKRYGKISCYPEQCDECRTTDYETYLKNTESEAYLQNSLKCCGYQNKLVKQLGKLVSWENIKDGFSFQRLLSQYIEGVINKTEPNGAYIEGGVGTGKTFWCKVLNNTLVEERRSVCFIRAVDLAIALRKETFGDQYKKVLEDFCAVPTLIIDDFGTQKNTEWVAETLFAILDSRYEKGKRTIITTNVPLSEIKDHSRLASRLNDRKWMHRILLRGPDLRIQ